MIRDMSSEKVEKLTYTVVRISSGRASASGSALSHNRDVGGVEAGVVLGRTDHALGADKNSLLAVIFEGLSGFHSDLDRCEPVVTGPFDLENRYT